MNTIRTPWYNDVDKNCPLNNYPTPQFERKDWLCLNGIYDYAITEITDSLPVSYDGKIVVPFAVESEISGVQKKIDENHLLWYRRNIELDERFNSKRVILHFCAVDWQCSVYIDGVKIGEHTGGYNPFSFDITDYLSSNRFELTVKVFDPTDKGHQQRGKQVLSPAGFWYTSTTGIWQTVWCEPVEEERIEKLRIFPGDDLSSVSFDIKTTADGIINVKISDDTGVVFDGEYIKNSAIHFDNPKLWAPDSPFLYKVELSFKNDTVKSYFGLRKYSIEKDSDGMLRLFLNNKPLFQKGLLDQGYWPESQLTAPTDEAMIFDIEKVKSLGFNMLRKHIKRECDRWYYHCDRLGILVWQDMMSGAKALNPIYAGALPNINVHVSDKNYAAFNRNKKEWRDEFKKELFDLIDSLYNCVSICCWVPFNEGWGQFDAKEISNEIKKYDSSRFVDHASGWHDQGGCDFKSVHKYVVPVHAPTKFKTAGRPFVLSEYGGYQLRINDHCWSDDKIFGLYLKFKDIASLSCAYEKLHKKQIIPLIKKGLCASIYTQVSDVENELNGIYTYDRQVLKLDPSVIKKVNNLLSY
ncbi:MAG: glycoside hydrolase family 2 [Clostridiales bacterium]|nr:glycoside hydrolase family 2 [Clostridiales bacterium]